MSRPDSSVAGPAGQAEPGQDRTQIPTTAEAFRRHAGALAAWAMEHLVVRTDRWGYYTDDGKTFTGPAASRPGKLTRAMLQAAFVARRRDAVRGVHVSVVRDGE